MNNYVYGVVFDNEQVDLFYTKEGAEKQLERLYRVLGNKDGFLVKYQQVEIIKEEFKHE